MTARTSWLHSLRRDQLNVLFDFRRRARKAYPQAENAMDTSWGDAVIWDDRGIPPELAAMPREMAVSVDLGL